MAEMKIRLPDDVRAAIEEQARERGVSMNAEITRRLEESFAAEAGQAEDWGSGDLYGLLKAVAIVMNSVGARAAWLADKDRVRWLDDPWAYDEASKAAGRVIDALRPPGEISPPTLPDDAGTMGPAMVRLRDRLGWDVAAGFLGLPHPTEDPEEARHKLLGALADRLPKGDQS